MHIADGILSAAVLAAGAGLAAAGVAMGLKRMDYERIPAVAVLASAFFVASLIHVQMGAVSAHLILNGLVGVILGWAAFPAVLVGLLLQAIMFGYGGLTALGVNTVVMALPGIVCYYAFSRHMRKAGRMAAFTLGFAAGSLAVVMSCFLLALAFFGSGKEFVGLVRAVLLAHVPVLVIEGIVTGSVVVFLRRVRPELLEASLQTHLPREATHA